MLLAVAQRMMKTRRFTVHREVRLGCSAKGLASAVHDWLSVERLLPSQKNRPRASTDNPDTGRACPLVTALYFFGKVPLTTAFRRTSFESAPKPPDEDYPQ